MSIRSNNYEAKREALREYRTKLVKLEIVEHNAMNEMLDVLRATDKPMTAAQIKAACTSDISTPEVAGNLFAMRVHRSRFENNVGCQSVPNVKVPCINRNKGERIIIAGGGRRKAMVVEIDESGKVIPNTKREIMIHESLKYAIEEVK